jgi:hypothetical protein
MQRPALLQQPYNAIALAFLVLWLALMLGMGYAASQRRAGLEDRCVAAGGDRAMFLRSGRCFPASSEIHL